MPSPDRRALDALPSAVYTVDLGGRVTGANRAATGSRDESSPSSPTRSRPPAGRLLWDVMGDPAGSQQVQHAIELLKAGRAPTVSWELHRTADADRRVFLVQMAPLFDGHAVEGFVVSATDITAAHTARQSLLDGSATLARLVDPERVFRELGAQARRTLPSDAVAIALSSADGGGRRFTVAYSAGFEGEGDALRGRLTPVWGRAMDEGGVVHDRTPSGLEITVPITGFGGRFGALTLLVDAGQPPDVIDSGVRALSALAVQTASAIERASTVELVGYKRRVDAIGEVASRVANELRNPLFGISSAAQLLRFRSREDPVVEKNVGRILRDVDWLNRVAAALLDYGRPADISLAPGDPDEVWDAVLVAQRGRLESRSLQVHRTHAKPSVRCHIDPGQLGHVFTNLLANAVDAAPEATDLTLISAVHDGRWQSRLTNAGPAIPGDSLPRIFDLFYSTKPGGTGIGLALAKRIVEGHGGTIAAESIAGVGTTLAVGLPAVRG